MSVLNLQINKHSKPTNENKKNKQNDWRNKCVLKRFLKTDKDGAEMT